MQIYKKMLEVVEPQTSSLASPKRKIKTRGRESKKSAKNSTKRMPSSFELVQSVYSQSSCTSKKLVSINFLFENQRRYIKDLHVICIHILVRY